MDTEDIRTKYQNEWKKVFNEVMDKYIDVNHPYQLGGDKENCRKELMERLIDVRNRYEEVEEDND